jgi:hypothetical protein
VKWAVRICKTWRDANPKQLMKGMPAELREPLMKRTTILAALITSSFLAVFPGMAMAADFTVHPRPHVAQPGGHCYGHAYTPAPGHAESVTLCLYPSLSGHARDFDLSFQVSGWPEPLLATGFCDGDAIHLHCRAETGGDLALEYDGELGAMMYLDFVRVPGPWADIFLHGWEFKQVFHLEPGPG